MDNSPPLKTGSNCSGVLKRKVVGGERNINHILFYRKYDESQRAITTSLCIWVFLLNSDTIIGSSHFVLSRIKPELGIQ